MSFISYVVGQGYAFLRSEFDFKALLLSTGGLSLIPFWRVPVWPFTINQIRPNWVSSRWKGIFWVTFGSILFSEFTVGGRKSLLFPVNFKGRPFLNPPFFALFPIPNYFTQVFVAF